MPATNESMYEASTGPVSEAKRELRERMRTLRRALPDRADRSARIVERLVALDVVREARRIQAYDSILGEVETAELVTWCAARDIEMAMPEDGVAADWPDVIVVPGTAFTSNGERLGQGGGWYDRFLPGRRDDAVLIGIGFSQQIVESLPTEPHDIALDLVVTENAVYTRSTGAVSPG